MNELENVYRNLLQYLTEHTVSLVAVSKTKPAAAIETLYNLGQRDFGENYVQEIVQKQKELPTDIRWHFIGHLQSNKVKMLAPFIHLIQGVDSQKLLAEINKQAVKYERVIDCLLQIHIAKEETKFGLDASELADLMNNLAAYPNVRVRGLMGMASFSDNMVLVRNEFSTLKKLFDFYVCNTVGFDILSMGMTSDYQVAIQEGSNMIRVGSMLFGQRVNQA